MSHSSTVTVDETLKAWAPEANAWPTIAVIALGGIAVLLASLQVIHGEFIPPVTVFAAAFLVLPALCLRFGPRARWPWFLAGAGAVLLVLGNLPFLVADLSHPETPFSFLPAGFALVLALLALAAAGLTALRKSLPHRPVLGAAGLASVALLAVSGVAVATLEKHTQQPGDVYVLSERVEFPELVTAPAGSFALYIDNLDRGRHTFVIDELDVHVELPGLVGRRVELNAPAGEYYFYCDVPGHDRMEGTLRVN